MRYDLTDLKLFLAVAEERKTPYVVVASNGEWVCTPAVGMIGPGIGNERMFPLTGDGLERAMRSLSK